MGSRFDMVQLIWACNCYWASLLVVDFFCAKVAQGAVWYVWFLTLIWKTRHQFKARRASGKIEIHMHLQTICLNEWLELKSWRLKLQLRNEKYVLVSLVYVHIRFHRNRRRENSKLFIVVFFNFFVSFLSYKAAPVLRVLNVRDEIEFLWSTFTWVEQFNIWII